LIDQPDRLLLVGGVTCQPRVIATVELTYLNSEFVKEGCRGVPPLADLAVRGNQVPSAKIQSVSQQRRVPAKGRFS
jgi:hypothetical protein